MLRHGFVVAAVIDLAVVVAAAVDIRTAFGLSLASVFESSLIVNYFFELFLFLIPKNVHHYITERSGDFYEMFIIND